MPCIVKDQSDLNRHSINHIYMHRPISPETWSLYAQTLFPGFIGNYILLMGVVTDTLFVHENIIKLECFHTQKTWNVNK